MEFNRVNFQPPGSGGFPNIIPQDFTRQSDTPALVHVDRSALRPKLSITEINNQSGAKSAKLSPTKLPWLRQPLFVGWFFLASISIATNKAKAISAELFE